MSDKKEKDNRKNRASIYTIITIGAGLMNPAFGVLVALIFLADIIFNFLKLDK